MGEQMDRVIFVCYLAKDYDVYLDLMQVYFPYAPAATITSEATVSGGVARAAAASAATPAPAE